MPNIPKNKISPFWILVILLLIIAGVLVLFRDVLPIGDEPAQQPPPPSTEWTTAPEGGVEVDLPETPIRAAEPDADDAQETGSGEGE